MKFGVREICDVVLKAKSAQKIGNKMFYKDEPVIYFDTLKTSTMEGAATTVYAQGGRGNSRLVAWEGERTITFTMEDALISKEGFMILSGAGLVEAEKDKPIYQHVTETIDGSRVDWDGDGLVITLSEVPYLPVKGEGDASVDGNYAYVMLVKNGEIVSEPYIPEHGVAVDETDPEAAKKIKVITHPMYDSIGVKAGDEQYEVMTGEGEGAINKDSEGSLFDSVIVDYYVARRGKTSQIEITADKFGGNYYLEASTLFRDQSGVDMPAEFIIPNCKVQSNFTFSMASSGDPSTFTFTMDAFPDYTRFDKSKKVLAAIQIIEEEVGTDVYRPATPHTFIAG